MIYLKLVYAVIYPIVLGFFFVNLFMYKKEDATLSERAALGFCAGIMLIAAEMFFVLPALHIRYSAMVISLSLLPVMLIGLYVTVRNGLVDIKSPRFKTLNAAEKLLVALLIIQALFVSSSLMIKPVTGWDAWANYSLRAKCYFIDGTVSLPYLSHTDRGQFNGLAQAWVFTCIGKWDEIKGKIFFPLYFISLLILFFRAVRRTRPRLIALLGTSIMATLPFLVYHATLEYCDFLAALYLFIIVSIFIRWLNKPELRRLLLLLVFMLFFTTVKNESFMHLAIVSLLFLVMLFTRRFDVMPDIRRLRSAAAAVFLLGAAYVVRMIFFRPQEAIHFAPSLDLSRLGPILSVYWSDLFIRNNWGIACFIFAMVLIFNFRRLFQDFNLVLLSIVVLEFAGFIVYYLTAADNVYQWLFYVTPAVRNTLQFMPVMMFLLANLLTLDLPSQ